MVSYQHITSLDMMHEEHDFEHKKFSIRVCSIFKKKVILSQLHDNHTKIEKV